MKTEKEKLKLDQALEKHLVALWYRIEDECRKFIKANCKYLGLAEVGPMTSRIYAKMEGSVPAGESKEYYVRAIRNRIYTDLEHTYGWVPRRKRIRREAEERAAEQAKNAALARGEKAPLSKMEKEFEMPHRDNGWALYAFLVPALRSKGDWLLAEDEIDAAGCDSLTSCSSLLGRTEAEAEEARRVIRRLLSELPENILMAAVEICDSAGGGRKNPCRCRAAKRWTGKEKTAALAELDKWAAWAKKELEARLGVPLSDLGFKK